jgi:hypothetical protein
MDPNAALRELRALATELNDDARIWDGTDGLLEHKDKADRAAELIAALDGWLSNGGFLPERWRTSSLARGRPLLRVVTRCGACPLIKEDRRGWSQGECQHEDAPGDNQTKTLNNRPSWCPLLERPVVLLSEDSPEAMVLSGGTVP